MPRLGIEVPTELVGPVGVPGDALAVGPQAGTEVVGEGRRVPRRAVDAAGTVAAFRVTAGEPWFSAVHSAVDLRGESWNGPVGPVWDVVRSFVLGERPYLLAYTAAGRGQFAFFPLTPDLHSARPHLFSRAREPGVTGGFDVVEPIVVGGLVHYMCYGFASGRVVIYSLQVTSTGMDATSRPRARSRSPATSN